MQKLPASQCDLAAALFSTALHCGALLGLVFGFYSSPSPHATAPYRTIEIIRAEDAPAFPAILSDNFSPAMVDAAPQATAINEAIEAERLMLIAETEFLIRKRKEEEEKARLAQQRIHQNQQLMQGTAHGQIIIYMTTAEPMIENAPTNTAPISSNIAAPPIPPALTQPVAGNEKLIETIGWSFKTDGINARLEIERGLGNPLDKDFQLLQKIEDTE